MKKLVMTGVVFVLVALGWGNDSLGKDVPTPRGELRVVDKSPSN
jgi:hypothetical protein